MRVVGVLILLCATIHTSVYAQDTLRLKKYFGNLKAIEVTVKGAKYDFLFDTGGGETFISPELASRLNKALYGQVTGIRMSGETLHYQKADSVSLLVNSTNLFHKSVGVWDIMTLLPKDFPRLQGVLSLKSFKDLRVTINLSQNYLLVETPSTFKKRIKQMHLLESRFANGLDGHELTIFLALLNQSHQYWFLFDSGNLNDVLLSHSTASEWGLQADTVKSSRTFPEVEMRLGLLMARGKASSTKLIYDGALNFLLLSQFVFTIDFPAQRVWIDHLTARNPK